MSRPLFVETSKGYINLALVTQITHHGNVMHFVFGGSQSRGEEGITPDWMELPEAEARDLITWLEANEPECFIRRKG
jgi:hypothetical protein